MKNNHITIFDTTLRDGEQAPGCSLYPEQKVEIARQLAKLGVDVIEPGFPASSPGEFAAVQQISRSVQTAEICGFARAMTGDIDAAVRATQDAAQRRLHLFISSSQIHLDYQLRKSRNQVLNIAREMVAYAKQFVDRIEFSPMDATRSDAEFLFQMVETVIAEGATIINLPDTVGYALPEEYGRLFQTVKRSVRGGDTVEYSAHCHNDLGLAVANSLAAITHGATHVEVTVNGIGERTGNCSLEELVMAIETRKDALGCNTSVQVQELYQTSRLVSRLMHFPVAMNKPIVGRNAFAHESGIHQDGLLKNRNTYEIMDPEQLGIPRSMIVLGKHSGRHALKHRVGQFGIHLTDTELEALFVSFKATADKQKTVSDEDLLQLLQTVSATSTVPYTLVDLQVITNNLRTRVATVTLRDNRTGEERSFASTGAGPVEAVIQCMKMGMPIEVEFLDLELFSLSSGETAQGEAFVTIQSDCAAVATEYVGTAVNPDIILAVAQAFLSACNQAVTAARSSGESAISATTKQTTAQQA